MPRRTPILAALVACLATVAPGTATAGEPPGALLGGDGPPRPLPDAAMIEMTEWGWRYIAGQQDSHLTITFTDGRLQYVDTGTAELRRLPAGCTPLEVGTGIGAECEVPERFAAGMYLQVWPRLGDDVVDGSTLPEQFRMWVLADAGADTMYGGAGDDFFNGAQDGDVGHGGAGDDWMRTGIGDDRLWGGPGDDRLVGTDGRDRLHGDEGADRVEGGSGRDRLAGGPGRDVLSCRGGHDTAYADGRDRTRRCERVLAEPVPVTRSE